MAIRINGNFDGKIQPGLDNNLALAIEPVVCVYHKSQDLKGCSAMSFLLTWTNPR